MFDFTPGNCRVGLVPWVRLVNKSGILNPLGTASGCLSHTGNGCMRWASWLQ